ncbi:MAG: VOC family protein [Clostridiales Family XIII bacterium]|jgi:methylmalonyl-CoA/ethylmalonyl-CoA epimerase|nr:VOC family protein [Clostridiales Family XIII bacterium]
MKKPVFDKVAQISVVVDDIYAYMRRYNDDYGIGPWTVLRFDRGNTSGMVVRGAPEDFEIRLAICDCLNIQWELIQPLSENGSYAEFLRKNGPGIHHVCMQPAEGYARIREILAGRGHAETLIGGVDSGNMEFAYVDLTDDLGFVVELMNPREGCVPMPPEDVYPR